jgi:thioesterase domain-containing protein
MNSESPPPVSLEEIRALLTEQLGAAAEPAPLPLSSEQQRLWFLDQLEPGSPRYNLPGVVWLKGPLNIIGLERALRAMIARHESLRARFISNEGEPEQIIASEDEFALTRQELPAAPFQDRDAMARRSIEEEVRRPFNLSRALPIRVKLLKLGQCEHVLITTMHHIISDDWSIKIFYRELAALYTAFVGSAAPDLPELPIQFADYALWQRDWLESGEFQEQLQFWREHLANHPLPVNLPTDRPRRNNSKPQRALKTRRLPPEFRSKIHQVAARNRVTPCMVLLAGFKALLHGYTGQREIVVGSAMACRTQVETENVIGVFANTLPLCTALSGEMTFEQLLSRVREGVVGAYSNQQLPFDKLVEQLNPKRVAGQTPFINVLFLFQNDREFPKFPDLQVTFLEMGMNAAKFDVTLTVTDHEAGLSISAEYNAQLFDAETMTAFLWNYENLLRAMVSDPTRRISKIPVDFHPEAAALAPNWTPEPEDAPRWEFFEHWFEVRRGDQSHLSSNGAFFEGNGNAGFSSASEAALMPLASQSTLPVQAEAQLETADTLKSILREIRNEPRESSLVDIQPEGSKTPLFLVHGVGGGMFWGYSNLSRYLGMDQPVFGFKSRGLEGEYELESVEALAASYMSDLCAFRPHGPFRLGGYCFGGLVAYEMARQLTTQGEAVEFLGLMNASAPNSSYTQFSWTVRSTGQFGMNLLRRFYYSARAHPAKNSLFLLWKMRSLIKERLNRMAGNTNGSEESQNFADVGVDLSRYNETQRRLWRTHYTAAANYCPQPYFGRVWLFRSPVHQLRCSFEPDYGWSKFASGGLTTKIIGSAHEAILEEPAVRAVAVNMQPYLS